MTIKIYDGGIVYFENWLKDNGYGYSNEIKENMAIDGSTEDEISIEIDRLYDEFCQWADEQGLTPMYS